MGNWFVENMKGEVSYDDIKAKAENGEFHQWDFQPLEFQENGYEDVLDEIKEYRAVDYLALEAKKKEAEKKGDTATVQEYQDEMDAMVDAVLAIYRENAILPIQYYSEFGVMEEVEKCLSYDAKFNGNVVSCGAGIGTTLCNYLFPNIFDTPSAHDLDKKNARSLYEKFHNDEYLRRAIKFCFSYKDGCPVPTNVMGGLRLVGSAPTNFRPMNAKAVYERFCPKEGTIYDFCCVRGDMEFYNGKVWKPISEYVKDDKVLQYCADGTAKLVYPDEYIHYQSDEPFYILDEYTPVQTGNHFVVYYDEEGNLFKEQLEVLLSKDDEYKESCLVPVTCVLDAGNGYLSYEDIVDTVEAIKTQDKTCMTEYNKLFDTGSIGFSDKVYSLSIYSRKKLLSCLGLPIQEGITFTTLEYTVSSSRDIGEACESIVAVYNTTVKGKAMWLPRKHGKSMVGEKVLIEIDSEPHFEIYGSFSVDEIQYSYEKDKYCFTVPSGMLVLKNHGTICITGNCGFGGRMLGALSSKNKYRYVGTDPCTETMYHLHELGEAIESVTGRENSYELHCCGSEDFRGPKNSIDFAFSSPPYFNLEVYSDEETQCYNKFPELDQWLEGYVRETIKNIGYMLKPGRCYAVNIADFKVGGGKECAYVDEWIRISTEEGMPLFDTVYLGVTARAGSAEQAAGELKKENILIFKKPMT